MASNVPGNTARDNTPQVTSYIRKTLNFADAGAFANGLPIGMLPAGAMVIATSVDVSAAFNSGTLNDVTVGTNATAYDNIATSAQIVAGTQGVKRSLSPTVRVDQITAPTMVFMKTNLTGTAATAGQLTLTIEFVTNRDL
jgi:hypothetical protein